MPNYEIEMLWECICGKAGNKGLSKHCTGCGRPKSEKSREYFPDDISENNAIHGPTTSKEPDWKCKYCVSDTLQSAGNKCCTECGCDKATGKKDWEGEELSATERADGSNRRVTSRRVHVNQVGLAPEIDVDPQPGVVRKIQFNYDTSDIPKRRRVPWGWMIAAACTIAAVAVLFIIFRTRELNSGVRSVAWRHTVHVDRNKLVPDDGWSVPSNAEQVQNQGPRYHWTDHRLVGHHQESYSDPQPCGHICGPKPACYTTSRNCTSQKNGKASCSGGDRVCPSADCSEVKYCPHTSWRTVSDYQDFPIYDNYYSWMEWRWVHDRDVQHQGATVQTDWPSDLEIHLNQSIGDRESERASQEEWYEVTLGHHGELWKFTPKSDGEFRLYPIGSRHEIKVNALGSVEIVKHGR